MKALTIPASSRPVHEATRSISAAVSNLRRHITVPRCLTTTLVATVGIFTSLAIGNDPALYTCATVSLLSIYSTDRKSDKKGGAE